MSDQERVGSISDEAAKLVDALRSMFSRGGVLGPEGVLRAEGVFGPGGALGPEHVATGAPECARCPLCQLIAVLRGDRPEVSERLADAGQAMASALRALLDSAATAHAEPAGPAEPESTTGERAPSRSATARTRAPRRLQRIDIGGD